MFRKSKVIAGSVALALCAAASGCSGSAPTDQESAASTNDPSQTSAAGTVAESAELSCEDNIGTEAAPAKALSVIDDVVALPRADRFGKLEADANPEDSEGSVRLFAKQPLAVRADRSFDLVVPEDERDSLAIAWGNAPSRYTWHLHVSCKSSDDLEGEWIEFAGGYYASEKMCATVTVRYDGRNTSVPIGVGESCAKHPETTAGA
jgi:hypothetical protein